MEHKKIKKIELAGVVIAIATALYLSVEQEQASLLSKYGCN